MEAVGIRLKDGEDYPDLETSGFSPLFVERERLLCARNEEGEVTRDVHGDPVLECMCGKVLRGQIDPAGLFHRGRSSGRTAPQNSSHPP